MSDALTFIALAANACNFKLEVSFKTRAAVSTDPSDQRDTWGLSIVTPEGRILASWDSYESRDEMFETAARAVAATAGQQMLLWDNQWKAKQIEAFQKAAAEKAKADAAEAEAKSKPKRARKRSKPPAE